MTSRPLVDVDDAILVRHRGGGGGNSIEWKILLWRVVVAPPPKKEDDVEASKMRTRSCKQKIIVCVVATTKEEHTTKEKTDADTTIERQWQSYCLLVRYHTMYANAGLPIEGIVTVNEIDIICGRGGLSLKHPGNINYRKIVNLNKKVYVTCHKTEKLRISMSIVAAVRDIKARFLEREDGKVSYSLYKKDEAGNPVVWRNIGDKRAIEKTSQALREGQPKLLKKLVDVAVHNHMIGENQTLGIRHPSQSFPPGKQHEGCTPVVWTQIEERRERGRADRKLKSGSNYFNFW